MRLRLQPQGMHGRKANTTRFEPKRQLMCWRVEWVFPAAENARVVDARCVAEQDLEGASWAHDWGKVLGPTLSGRPYIASQAARDGDPGRSTGRARQKE